MYFDDLRYCIRYRVPVIEVEELVTVGGHGIPQRSLRLRVSARFRLTRQLGNALHNTTVFRIRIRFPIHA
jgi:hypothetical protein